MAHSHNHDLGADLKPLSEISNYTIEEGDPDPRGYDVVSRDGRRIGEVEDLIIDTAAMKVRYLVVELDDDAIAGGDSNRSILLSPEHLELPRGTNRVIAHGYTGTEAAYTRTATANRTADDERTLTRTEEELHVGKREVDRGEARIGKHVETERVSQPVTRRREEVVIERRPVEAGARGSANISDEEIRVPLMEEELVVEKRPVVKEELVIGKRVVEERDTVETELRREEFDIDTNPAAPGRTRGRNDR